MGLATAFGPTFFFRVILPGIVFAVAVQPLSAWLYAALGLEGVYGLSRGSLLAATAITIGLILAAASRSVYYLFEGFSWPALTERLRRRTLRRVQTLATRQAELATKGRGSHGLTRLEHVEAMRIAEKLRDVPVVIGPEGPRYELDRPTVLGNLIASYELYPTSRYGIDGEFYLPHAVNLAPEGVQLDLDQSEAMADGMVLSCFGMLVAAVAHGLVLLGVVVGGVLTRLGLGPLVLGPERAGQSITYAAVASAAALLFYRLSLAAHRTYGRKIRTVTDMVAPKLVEMAKGPLPTSAERHALQQRREYLETLEPPHRSS
ncbi:MAG TPA: hypothetical protein VEU55_03985 [Gemmatimonadales bacterium]|nr:hypothetical protein [Gemmatimonadales bacterium]